MCEYAIQHGSCVAKAMLISSEVLRSQVKKLARPRIYQLWCREHIYAVEKMSIWSNFWIGFRVWLIGLDLLVFENAKFVQIRRVVYYLWLSLKPMVTLSQHVFVMSFLLLGWSQCLSFQVISWTRLKVFDVQAIEGHFRINMASWQQYTVVCFIWQIVLESDAMTLNSWNFS